MASPSGRLAFLFILGILGTGILAGCAVPAASSQAESPTAAAELPSPPTSAVPSEAPTPAPSVGEGEEWIVFQGAPLGLSLIRPDGTGNHVILGPPGDQLHPDWSPDGSLIAYVQDDDAGSDIWITDPAGSEPAPLFAEAPAELEGLFLDNPSWSPDGTQIAAVGYEGDPQTSLPTRSVLAVVDVESGAITMGGELLSADGSLHSFPRWSPDGRALVIVRDRFDGEEYVGGEIAIIRRSDAGWSELEPITDVVAAPRADWHPIEDLIVYCTNDVGSVQVTDEPSNLFTVRPDGSELTQVTDFGPGEERASQPSWTADGRIIFTHIAGSNDEELTVAFINADGSVLEEVIGTDAVGIGNRPHPRLRPAP